MKKLLISGGLSVLVIPSLCYYIAKYCIYKTLTFEESMIVMFVILCSLIIFGLLFGSYNTYKLLLLTKENIELNNKIDKLTEKLVEFHYDNIEYHENNRDIILDSLDLGGE